MMDDELKKLKDIKVPRPSDAARERAVFAAMEAFDAAESKNISPVPQGSADVARPTSIDPSLWSKIMNAISKPAFSLSRAKLAALSGVMLLPVAGVVSYSFLQDEAAFAPVTQETRIGDDAAVTTDTPKDLEKTKPVDQVAKLENAPVIKQLAEEAEAPRAERRSQGQSQGQSQGLGGLLSAAPQQDGRVARKARPSYSRPNAGATSGNRARIASKPAPLEIAEPAPQRPVIAEGGSEKYTKFDDNAVKSVATNPVSTFSIDVDTASYSRVRRSLLNGTLPNRDMVRVEEMINYFDYSYKLPENRDRPFRANVTITPTPWNTGTKLMHIGIQGFDIEPADRPKANLVFLLDVSGSMSAPDKLPLLIKSFRLLLSKLNPDDTVSIVTYAGHAGTALKPTKASDRTAILSALENLRAGGSTAGAQGIEQAYRLAQQAFVKDGVNRVMLATDGDFNVGISNPDDLKTFIAEKRKSGIFLSVFGFGRGNYNDALMQSLAQNGNGTAAYIDTLAEAQKTLVQEAGSTLFPIAKDVKIQMEFNPAQVAEYRLIGYETRALKREDFNNDKVDAGDIGSGHSVTAIYEITPVGSDAVLNTPLRYGEKKEAVATAQSDEIGFLKLRYKLPKESKSKLIETPVTASEAVADFGEAAVDVRFSVAVAAFAQKLRGNTALSDTSYENIATMAAKARGDDLFGYRSTFLQLVRMAGGLANSTILTEPAAKPAQPKE
ncbi:MAG: VWA domain-containing protein [Pseudomonadota bacterium]